MLSEVRKFVRDVLSELELTQHFKDRAFERLQSSFTTFSAESQDVKKTVMDAIKFLEDVDFSDMRRVGIRIYRSNKMYVLTDAVSEKKYSGNNIWLVKTNVNDALTILFKKDKETIPDIDYYVDLENIKKYLENWGKNSINKNDLENILKGRLERQVSNEKREEPVFILNGTKYLVDKDKSQLYQKNNPNKRIDIESIFDDLTEPQQEMVFAMIAQ